MSSFNQSSKDQISYHEKQFFTHYYNESVTEIPPWKYLKDKYSSYKQQSYNNSKHSSEISFIKKFIQICNYMPFVGQIRAQKIQISLIQEIMEVIYNDYQAFFADQGWRVVKNKSLKARLQQYLLLKLWKSYHQLKLQGGLDNFILGFFYTLNYYKTCNYQIRLFNDFLLHTDLQSFFVFILLKKRSRRVNKDLSIKSDYISSFVQVMKGQRNFPPLCSYSSENEEMGEVKLLLIYPQIMQYINNNGVVLHQVMLYSLMRCAGLNKDSISEQPGAKIDWNQFFLVYFQKSNDDSNRNYCQEFIGRVVKANLKMADHLFALSESNVTFVEEKIQPRQMFLEESFGWLITILESIITDNEDCNHKWRKMYKKLLEIYQYNLVLGNKLVQSIFKSQDYFHIYKKYYKNTNT